MPLMPMIYQYSIKSSEFIDPNEFTGICTCCGKKQRFIDLALWTDMQYHCALCFGVCRIENRPNDILVLKNDFPPLNRLTTKYTLIVTDGLYIAGVQRHILSLIDAFKRLNLHSIVLSLEGGGAWVEKFIKSCSILLVSNDELQIQWTDLERILPSRVVSQIQFVCSHLFLPSKWALENLPDAIKLIIHMHSEPSEHEVVTRKHLESMLERCNKMLFPALSTLNSYKGILRESKRNYQKMHVLENSLFSMNRSTDKPSSPSSPYNVAVISRIDSDKFSIDLFIRTIMKLKMNHQSLKVRVAGNGELMPVLRKEIKDNNLEQEITLEGFVYDIDRIYQWASVTFLPSKRESMPYVMLESLSYGIPIVLPLLGYVENSDISDKVLAYKKNNPTDAAKKIETAFIKRYNFSRDLPPETNDENWISKLTRLYLGD